MIQDLCNPLGEFRGGGQKIKIQLCHNTVMLHIKLKGITNAAARLQIFCSQTPTPTRPWGWDQQVKIQLFQNMVMLHIKLKRIKNAAKW